ncbi:protein quick-to-court isoform X1 [Amyelois transitella]|uniref:protein quick-to-court isoform X1 n=1 Tax=Amyelois transitella TaxID=680683 RepID=UPI00298FFC79|nr:protein quick-to-court isoform X1 [Amyelois transitella]XP_060804691.1 protein quick-to-court isoform X1 [Amyelois transitella]
MSRNYIRRLPEFHDEHCCAGNVTGNFRRTSSLRLRGEKMVQRSPLSTRKLIPIITENTHQKNRSDGLRLPEPGYRQRSHSFSNNGQKPRKPCLKSQDNCDGKLSMTDSAHTPPGSPEDLPDDESLHSYGSAATAASVDAGYAPFNGTTFSGRSMRYVLHCSSHAGLSGDEYLTPTQRAQKQIRRLKSLLTQAKKDLEKKDSEIFHLTKEVVELRLYKASICSPDEKSNSSEIVTIRENAEDLSLEQESPKRNEACRSFDVTDSPLFKDQTPTRCRNEMQGSFTDSGHFDDLTNSSLHSKESVHMITQEASCMTELEDADEERRSLIMFYEKKVEDVMRNHVGETQELKKAHNDKVEALLQKLADVNTRYCELLPNYEQAKERIHSLEKQLEEASRQLHEEESRHRSLYLQMYQKGVEAAKFELDKDGEASTSQGSVNRVSVEELLEQLQITQIELENVRDTAFTSDRTAKSQVLLSAKEAVSLWVLGARKAMYRRIVESQKGNKTNVDPEVTLQFLKSAIYYFLTDPENHQGHLNAIENILGFTEAEKKNIRKARTT